MPFDTATMPGLNERDSDLRVLLKVRDSISRRNAWRQGRIGAPGSKRHCIMGWVFEHLPQRLLREDSSELEDIGSAEALIARRLASLVDPGVAARMRNSLTGDALAAALCSSVVIYNDTHDRSQADMIRLLDLAIDELIGANVEPAM
jgi:hypothetical protein